MTEIYYFCTVESTSQSKNNNKNKIIKIVLQIVFYNTICIL